MDERVTERGGAARPCRVKVCGITRLEDALGCVERGAGRLGLNFWAGTARRVELGIARQIASALADRVELVGVFVDASIAEILETRRATGIELVQLHGEEPPALLEALLPRAYKALRVAGPEALLEARRFAGEELLVDASVPGQVGGTGQRCDWEIAAAIARERTMSLAGGLRPENVAEAIARVRPAWVDVASGVERAPGVKDLDRVEAFIRAVQAASIA